MGDGYSYNHMLQVDHVVGVISASRGLVHRADHVLWPDSSENRRGHERKSPFQDKIFLKEQFCDADWGHIFKIFIFIIMRLLVPPVQPHSPPVAFKVSALVS